MDRNSKVLTRDHSELKVRVTELSAKRHLPGRERGNTASSALCIISRSHHAGDTTLNGRPRLRSCWTTGMEQPARRNPSQFNAL